MAKTLLLFIVLVSLVEKSTQTEGDSPPLFVGTSTPGGPSYFISPTGEKTEVPLVKPVYRAAIDGRNLFFTSRNDESVSHYDRNTGVESTLITMEGRVSGIALDRRIKRVFVWVRNVGIRSFDYEGHDVITVASVQNGLDAPTMYVEEMHSTILYILDQGNVMYIVTYETSPQEPEQATIPARTNDIFVGVEMITEMNYLQMYTSKGALYRVNPNSNLPWQPNLANEGRQYLEVTSMMMFNYGLYYTDVAANKVWRLVVGTDLVQHAGDIGNIESMCLYNSVVESWGPWSEWTSGPVKTRSRECLEEPDQVVASVMCSGNSSETQGPPAPIWNCPKLWRNCYGNGRCLPYYYGGRQIKSLATCECNEGFTGLWCDLRTDGSSVIWPWMSKRRVRTRRLP